MIEKVNPMHPDKLADRIAGALVDLAYKEKDNPKIAVEILIGHGRCLIINETDTHIIPEKVFETVERIAGKFKVEYIESDQDEHLSRNQEKEIKCGDNGIFKGVPLTDEDKKISQIARNIYYEFETDGKYIINEENKDLIICQSNAKKDEIINTISNDYHYYKHKINPLGYWTGGTDVDTGATNRKLGSDMGRSVTGGGLHGKDLSKADVSVNIYAFLKAQKTGKEVNLYCAIGDKLIDNRPYSEIVEIARDYINKIGGFEKFAEWGLF